MLPGLSASLIITGTTALGGGGGGGPVTLKTATYERFSATGPASASFTLGADGQASGTGGVPYAWLNAGAAGDYDVSWNGGVSWLSLSASRTISLTSYGGFREQSYQVRIRKTSTGVTLATATITLSVESGLTGGTL